MSSTISSTSALPLSVSVNVTLAFAPWFSLKLNLLNHCGVTSVLPNAALLGTCKLDPPLCLLTLNFALVCASSLSGSNSTNKSPTLGLLVTA